MKNLIPTIFKETYQSFKKNNGTIMGAAVAYYAIFSLVPFLILVSMIATNIIGKNMVNGQINHNLAGLMGANNANYLESVIENRHSLSGNSLIAIISLIILFFGTSGVFRTLRYSLNLIWGAQIKNNHGIIGFIQQKVFLFITILVVGLLMVFFLAVSTLSFALSHAIGSTLNINSSLIQVSNIIASFFLLGLLFTALFRLLPSRRIAWNGLIVGGFFTATLFVIGTTVLSIYLSFSNITSAYGTAGSLISILIWLYYSGQIFFFGAEFTRAYAVKNTEARRRNDTPRG